MKIKLLGSSLTKEARAIDGAFAPARVYHLAPLHLLKVGCPKEIAAARENKLTTGPIIVEKNRQGYGRVASTDYTPQGVVVAGGDHRAKLLNTGMLIAMAWIEAGLKINADDAISCQELMSKLQAEVLRRMYGDRGPAINQPYPCVLYVYPFENYLIFEMGGQKYRELYTIDPVARTVALSGQPEKVDEKFVSASMTADGGMPKVQTGARIVSNPIGLVWNQVSWRGGPTSELMTQVIRNFSNINEMVSNLKFAIKYGLYTPQVPNFAPVPLSSTHKLIAPFIKAGIAPVDVVGYAAQQELATA